MSWRRCSLAGVACVTLAATVLRGLARGIGRFDLQNTHDRVLAVGMLVVVVALLGWRDGSAQDVLIAVIVVQNCAASWLGLRVLALMRFANPEAEIRVAGGREGHLRDLGAQSELESATAKCIALTANAVGHAAQICELRQQLDALVGVVAHPVLPIVAG